LERTLSSVLVLACMLGFVPSAIAQMPDPKQMSGVPLPVGDLATGTVTVRVVRGTMTNVITGQRVEIIGPSPMSAKTNDAGRAEFTGLQPGTRVRAATTVDGEYLESQEFAIPSNGGVRIALVATDPAAQKQAGSAPPAAGQVPAAQIGAVVLGQQSRFIFEMGEEALNAFAVLEIVNAAGAPVQTAQPVVFELPSEARGAGLLEGSTPQASILDKRIIVRGPFAPGTTSLQFGYSLPISGASLTLEQRLPLPLGQVSVMAQKVGDMQMESPQVAEHRDMPLGGETFIVGKGPAIPAGQVMSFTFTGLPHQPVWPRNLALALALAILGAGVWGTMRRGAAKQADDGRRQRLDARRDRLFAELMSLEEQHRERTIDPERFAARRRELVTALERVYAQLDDEAAA
jgi:hypothetical protein